MKWVTAALVLLLFATNALWLYKTLDVGVTLSYRDEQVDELEATRKQLMAVFPEVAKAATKSEVIEAAQRHSKLEPYEKDGCTWVGWLGLKFDAQDRLESVSPTWSYGGEDPCHPAF